MSEPWDPTDSEHEDRSLHVDLCKLRIAQLEAELAAAKEQNENNVLMYTEQLTTAHVAITELEKELAAARAEITRLKMLDEFPPCPCCDLGHEDEECSCFDGESMPARIRALRAEIERLKELHTKRSLEAADAQQAHSIANIEIERLNRRCEEARNIISQCSLSGSAHWFVVMSEKREKWLEGKP